MSGNIVNFNAAANTANTNDGTPQVSILASASAKRMQERRRQSRLLKSAKGMGVGKKYPGVGTHHRNTKHVWLYSELAEVSAAYKEHHTTMPCWKIADMLYYSFGEQLKHNNDHQQANIAEVDQQDQPIAQLREPRIHLPSIQAIQAKLMDCITLEHNDTFGYASQPTQMHKQVWEHLELSEKHRIMLKQMAVMPVSMSAPVQIKEEQEQDMKLNPLAPIWNVHPREFLFNTDAEFEATLPPAKRRKVVFEDEEVQEQPQIKTEFDAGIAELVSLMGQVDDARRQEYTLIQRLVSQIREHNDQIGSLVSNIKDSHAEIEQHRQAIAHKMQQIESIIIPVPLPTPITTAATTAPPAMVCNKCTRTIEGGLGGFSVSYADPSHPDNETIECDECAPLSPASRKFVEQQKEADLEAEYSEMGRAIEHHLERKESCYSSDDDDLYANDSCYYPGFEGGYYDHAEECS
jgi:hypothetical protein